MSLSGIHCPITTPFIDDRLATDRLIENLQKLSASGLDGFVVLGSTGEAVYLNHSEKLELIKAAREFVTAKQRFIVGAGAESTRETIEFTEQAAKLGADYVLVKTPYYYKGQMDSKHLTEHFISVAERSPIPVIVYNVPKFTGVDISSEAVGELAQHHNIAGIKDSTDSVSKISELLRLNSPTFEVLIGNASLFLPGLFLGAKGAILALCNIAPEQCVKIFELVREDAPEQARKLYLSLIPIAKVVVGQHGIPAIKSAMDMLGYFGGSPRRPLLPADGATKTEIYSLLKKAELV